MNETVPREQASFGTTDVVGGSWGGGPGEVGTRQVPEALTVAAALGNDDGIEAP